MGDGSELFAVGLMSNDDVSLLGLSSILELVGIEARRLIFGQRILKRSLIATYLLNLVCRTVQTVPSCVQEMQGTPVSVMLQRTFRFRHFSQAMAARERRADMLMTSAIVRCRWRCMVPYRPKYLGDGLGAKQIEPRRTYAGRSRRFT